MSIWTWLGAVFPILFLFLMMSIFHMKTERAAFLGIICAVISALVIGKSTPQIVTMDLGKGAFSALNILIVIWPAVFLYEMMEFAGVFQSIKQMLQKKTQDELVMVLLICWLFSSFLQGITGFGVPVAVCAPILIALGVQPLWSVIITLLGHAWANTYGTFALAWDALIAQSETQKIFETKLLAGLLLLGVNLAGAILISWLYGKGKALRHILPFLIIISLVQGGGQLIVSFTNSTIAAFIPTTLALVVGWFMLGTGFYTKPWKMDSKLMVRQGKEDERNKIAHTEQLASGDKTNITELLVNEELEKSITNGQAIFPFIILAVISVIILLIKPVHEVMNQLVFALSFPQIETGRGFIVEATDSYGAIHIFTHAGFVLLLTVIITLLLYLQKGYLDKQKMQSVVTATLKKIIPTSLGILFLIVMSQVLKGSGIMQLIAQGVTQVTGKYYSFAVPFLGLLGAFVTSSNTSSNILLGSFQKTAADMISVNEAAILAAQTAGGAIGTVVGPSTILLGTTTAGCEGKEGEVLRFMLPIVLVEAAIVGLMITILI
nr:L-lactate permease [uncultured Anaerobutyricum sp.]